jgi:hypothetical protein
VEGCSPLGARVRRLGGDDLVMFDGIPLGNYTPQALLGITVLLVVLGWLVPRKTLQDKASEAERWRLAYEAERAARATADAQTAELLELAKTTHDIIIAMFGTTERVRQSGGASVVPTAK